MKLVLLFPLLGFLFNGLIGILKADRTRIGKSVVSIIGSGSIGLSLIFAINSFKTLISFPSNERVIKFVLFEWIHAVDFHINFGFQIDPLSEVMMLVVTGVGFLIHVYSIGYMREDTGYARYFSYLNLFTFSMLTLVLADNFLVMYLGWEGVGLCSYLLIGFWYERPSAANAGKKAFIVNRIGDFGFAIGIFLIFSTFGSLDFDSVFSRALSVLESNKFIATMIPLLLFFGATGKSAQIPLYVWLPDAMEGPTPVSALIHAATMVTAGVYMVARCHVLYLLSPLALTVVAIVGVITAVYAASIGLVQNDIKRVLAYSTISQLGLMFLGCGVGAFSSGIFHLMTHAFFKALLFLCAGSVIHALSGEQNIQKMGGLFKSLPFTYPAFAIGALAISGFPGLSGFFSKDEILLKTFLSGKDGTIFWLLGLLGSFFTAFYMARLFFLVFHGSKRGDWHSVHEASTTMLISLGFLSIGAVIVGYLNFPKVFGGKILFEEFLGPTFQRYPIPLKEFIKSEGQGSSSLEMILMMISTFIALCGIALAYEIYVKRVGVSGEIAKKYNKIYNIVFNKYFVDELYGKLFVAPGKRLATFLSEFMDMRIVDGLVNGIGNFFQEGGGAIKHWQTGYVRTYAFVTLAGVVLILGYLLMR